jgi:hypothetical protein
MASELGCGRVKSTDALDMDQSGVVSGQGVSGAVAIQKQGAAALGGGYI